MSGDLGTIYETGKNERSKYAESRKGVYSSVKFCKNEFGAIFRYSARTRVIIEENSVRIVQRMKNPAARFCRSAKGVSDQTTLVAYTQQEKCGTEIGGF